MRLPARRRSRSRLPRGVGGRRGTDGVDDRRTPLRGLRRARPAAAERACARTRPRGSERVRARGHRAHARNAGLGSDGRRAHDLHTRMVHGLRRGRRRDPAARLRSRAQDRAGDRAHATRERDRGSGHGALQARHRCGDERGADRRGVARIRPRRGHGLGGQGRPRARLLARVVGAGHQDLLGHDVATRRGGRADALRDLGLRRRLLVRSHEEPRRRRPHTTLPRARGRPHGRLPGRCRLRPPRGELRRARPANPRGDRGDRLRRTTVASDLSWRRRARTRAAVRAPGRWRRGRGRDGACNRARMLYRGWRWPARRGQLPHFRRKAPRSSRRSPTASFRADGGLARAGSCPRRSGALRPAARG